MSPMTIGLFAEREGVVNSARSGSARLVDLPLSEDTIQKIMSAMFVDYFFAGCCLNVTMLFNDSLGRLTKQRKTTRDKWVESHDSKSVHVLLDSW
ncbi:hypothetical protein Tco_0364227 [Tanacetum coccineum]